MDTELKSKRQYPKEQLSYMIGSFVLEFFVRMQELRESYTLYVTRNGKDIPLLFGKAKQKYGYMSLHLHDKPADEMDEQTRMIRIMRGKEDYEYSCWNWYGSISKQTLTRKVDKRSPAWQQWDTHKIKVDMRSVTTTYLYHLPMPIKTEEPLFSCVEALLEQLSQKQYKKLVKWMLRYKAHPTEENLLRVWRILNDTVSFEADLEDMESERFISPIKAYHNSKLPIKAFSSQKFRHITGKW